MTRILAIDPGNTHSGWVTIDRDTCKPIEYDKTDNNTLIEMIGFSEFTYTHSVIEMVASYGMPVGAEVFETCVWIGRFYEGLTRSHWGMEPELTYRRDVKLHHCHSSKAKDSNITQALIDRFTPGQPNHGKGTKADPGWFYGFKVDIWQSYALAVQYADLHPPDVDEMGTNPPTIVRTTETVRIPPTDQDRSDSLEKLGVPPNVIGAILMRHAPMLPESPHEWELR